MRPIRRSTNVASHLRRAHVCVLLLGAAFVAACGHGEPAVLQAEKAEAASDAAAASPPEVARRLAPGVAATHNLSAGLVDGPFTQPAPTSPQEPGAAMLIRTGHARVQVDSLEPAIARVQDVARRVGGYVTNSSVQSGDRRLRSAHLVLRVPSDRFDEAIGALPPVGDLESLEVNAQDVGEEFVDLTARLENARRLESRLLELLRTRTGKLDEVLAMERELARVREEIERLEGRLRYLQSRVALSTLAVELREPAPLVASHPGERVIVDAMRQAWRNFVGVIAGTIAALGVVLPVGVMGGLLVLGGRSLWRYAAGRRAAAEAAG